MVRRTSQWVSFASVVVVLLGCNLKKLMEKADAGDAAPSASAAADAAPGVVAANQADVTHYPGEAPANETLTTNRFTPARTEIGAGGKVVATLRPGTEVLKVAGHEGFDLVVFDDPSNASQKLEGWVSHFVLGGSAVPHEPEPAHSAAADAGPAPAPVTSGSSKPAPCKPQDTKRTGVTCPAPYAPCGAACRLTCKADADCACSTSHCVRGMCMGPGAAPCR